jgi:hypothetical protein
MLFQHVNNIFLNLKDELKSAIGLEKFDNPSRRKYYRSKKSGKSTRTSSPSQTRQN